MKTNTAAEKELDEKYRKIVQQRIREKKTAAGTVKGPPKPELDRKE